MALMDTIYPFVARVNDSEQYAIGGSKTSPDRTPLPPELVHTARDSRALGRILSADYYSRTGGARIEYESIPSDVKERLQVVRPLTEREREDFAREFTRNFS